MPTPPSVRVLSADSHITEPPDTYVARIDPRFRDRAPRLVRHEQLGDVFVIDGMKRPVPMGLVAAAGKPSESLSTFGARFDELHRGGWDPEARLAEQDRDGVAGEVIYPTVGMVLCNHRDLDYKKACFDAYNRWIAEYAGKHPDRLFGIGQTAVRTPEEAVRDLEEIRRLGLRGVMLPGYPGVEDWDDSAYDPLWEAAVALGLPLSFHILTVREELGSPPRGPPSSPRGSRRRLKGRAMRRCLRSETSALPRQRVPASRSRRDRGERRLRLRGRTRPRVP